MKYLSIKSMAWITAMVSTSISAQSTVPDETTNLTSQFNITKVKYQAEDEMPDKTFNGKYFLNIAASGSTPTEATGDYDTFGSDGCLFLNNVTGAYDVNLRLPDGHRIDLMRYYFKDGDTGGSQAYLYRMDGDGTFSLLANVVSTGNSGTYTSEFVNLSPAHYVDNSRYSYVLRFDSSQIGTNQRMCSVRLWIQAT